MGAMRSARRSFDRLTVAVIVTLLTGWWVTSIDAIRSTCLLSETVAQSILAELSGVQAKLYVTRLTAYHRTPASSGFHQAVELVRRELADAHVTDVVVELTKPDSPQPWQPRQRSGLPRWEVTTAELHSLDPREKIVSFDEEPICLARYSRSGRVTADLVDVGSGLRDDEYTGRDVVGKLVLATGYAASVERIAVGKYGAAGVIISGPRSYNKYTGWGYPDMVNWQVLSAGASEGREPTFAFVISEAQGERLRSRLLRGSVRVSALVESRLDVGFEEVLTAAIPGASLPHEQVLLLGHLDHVRPSANDNASGSGLLIEIARTLQRLIETGRLTRPARTIRFLWMTEGAGTVAYLNAHPTLGDTTVAALNLDMVGEFLVPGSGPMRITRTPDSLPSFLVDAVDNFVRYLDTQVTSTATGSDSFFNWRFSPFSANSDHYTLNDGAIRIPTLLIHHDPDPFHHANLDQPDRVDPTQLRRSGFVAAASAYFLASAGPREAYRLATEVYGGGSRRLSETAEEGLRLVEGVAPTDRDEAYGFAERKLAHVADRERGALESVVRLAPGWRWPDEFAAALDAQRIAHEAAFLAGFRRLAGREPTARQLRGSEPTAARIVPRRSARFINERWRQELDPALMTADQRAWLDRYLAQFRQAYIRIPELLNFVDGRRSVLEIRDRVSSEYFDWNETDGPIGHSEDISLEYRRIPVDDVLRLMRLLESQGLLSLEEPK